MRIDVAGIGAGAAGFDLNPTRKKAFVVATQRAEPNFRTRFGVFAMRV